MTFSILGSSNVVVRPFKVFKSQSISYTSGSGVFAAMNVAAAIRFPLTETFLSGTLLSGPNSGSSIILTQSFLEVNSFTSGTSPSNEDGTFQEPLYSTVVNMFYASGSRSGSATFAAAGDGIRDFPLSESIYIVNLAQRMWGEGIRRGSFLLSTPSAGSGTIIDNGRGRLFVSGSDDSLNVVGNIFYNLGIAVINRLKGAEGSEFVQETGMFFDSGSTLQANFQATQKLFEWNILATLNPYEFNYPMNPSALSSNTMDLIGSGTLSPYITTIGLYNDRRQLVAIAKLPHPIRRLVHSQQSFMIKFDI